MSIEFSTQPGPRERHLIRKSRNPALFSVAAPLSQAEVAQAQQRDETELNHFLRYFRDLVQEAIELKPNSDSSVVLDIKERLDQCYTHCCALPGDQSEIKAAVNKLVEVIMKAIRQGAANDPVALNKLDEEDVARAMHNQLAEHVFVADLLLPDSPISEQELVPSLLCESEASVAAALQLFDAEQLSSIYAQASELLQKLSADNSNLNAARQRLEQIKQALNSATAVLKMN